MARVHSFLRLMLIIFAWLSTDLALAQSKPLPSQAQVANTPLSNLKVSENRRYLVTESGEPFFWLGDAENYGRWLGERYRNAKVIWVLGGDRPIENDGHREIIRAMARGLRAGDGGVHLRTFHPTGGTGSAQWFHGEEWLDFNMRQNKHQPEFTGRYEQTRADYDRMPHKPVFDAEPIYEDHPVSFKANVFGHSIASDVSRPLYWNLLTGAFGHTYGHHSVWQMFDPKRHPGVNAPLIPWKEAILQPGADQMQHAKHLLLSRSFLSRIPDDSIIVTSAVPSNIPGAGRYRFVATRDTEGTYAMVYAPVGRAFQVRMEVIKCPLVKAWWFNPRDGKATIIGTFDNQGEREFTPPSRGEMLDWVLVLDDATKDYPCPGTRAITKQSQTKLPVTGHRIAVDGTRFTLNNKPFAYTGVSFFNAIYNPTFNATAETRQAWLKKFQAYGINVIRVWCQWDNRSGFVDASPSSTLYEPDGSLRPKHLVTLKAMLTDADELGMSVEIVLFSQESYLAKIHLASPTDEQAVAALTRALMPHRNATFQIWNEHSDSRVLPLFKAIKAIDPQRLFSNSPGYSGDLGSDEENTALDYLSPHTTRNGRYWETAPSELASLIIMFRKPVVDDEPARNGTSQFGGPQDRTSPFDHIVQIQNVWRVGAYPTYHHDMFQTGYGTPAVPLSGIPDPEFNQYHRTVFDFLSRRERLEPGAN